MNKFINMNLPTERHPFVEYIPDKCLYLLVGSFPPIKLTEKIQKNIDFLNAAVYYNAYSSNSRNNYTTDDILFYYGSRDNLLWRKIIGPIFNINFSSKDDVINFLKVHKIGITDICEEISRSISNQRISSQDQDIIIHKFRNFERTISDLEIKTIFTTSEWVTEKIKSLDFIRTCDMQIITLPSPSKSASRSIGRQRDYKELKAKSIVSDTIHYRQLKYIELLKNII